MPKESVLNDAAKSEIAAAVAIVASDKTYGDIRKIREHLIPPTPENDPPKEGDPTPPPKKDNENDGQPKRIGLWWGEQDEADAS